MKVRDPKKRIILPGEAPNNVDVAVQEMRMREALENNPMVQMIQELKLQNATLSAQTQVLMVRLQALTDYLAHVGLLLHQDLDDTGKPMGTAPYTPMLAATKVYEAMEDATLIEMPRYGYTTFFAEYSIRTRLLANLLTNHNKGMLPFPQIIEHIRSFNNEPDRLAPILGHEFGLPDYLNQNPDQLTSEELDTLAAEFGLRKEEEEDEQEGFEVTTPEEL